MHNEHDDELKFEVLAASLKMGSSEQKDLIEALVKMLSLSIPESITVARSGWLLSKDKPVTELTIRFDEYHYRLIREASGTYSARALKMVRGVALKTTDLELDACFTQIIDELTRLAK